MIKKHYTGLQRRAENIIWNAAGDYSFDPPYMAFYENGQPDPYFNLVIGLTHKWLDLDRITEFFQSLDGSIHAEEWCEILWLGIENCVYLKELPERPRLEALRIKKAEEFFKSRGMLSRQQMMLQSMTVYNQQQARWSKVLGKRGDLLSPKGRKLQAALEFPGNLDTEGVIQKMQEIVTDLFHGNLRAGHTSYTPVSGLRRAIASRLLRHQSQSHDTLFVRNGTGTGDETGSVQLAHAGSAGIRTDHAAGDRAYIEAVLGRSILGEQDLHMLENNLCAGPHAFCRLWVSKPCECSHPELGHETRLPVSTLEALSPGDRRELTSVLKQAGTQALKNQNFQKDHSIQIASGIRKLSSRVDEVLSGTERALPELARQGRLSSELAYRLPILHDTHVFLQQGDETERSVSLDLLLDASASRLNYQEELAAQAKIIAESFSKARVAVQVEAFRSVRGYTALQILKDRNQKDTSGVSRYFAGGWNRDGLGLRLAGSMLPDKDAYARRILFVLTDASPNDSVKLPPERGSVFAREYQGSAAVLDAKQAVTDLRKDGISVAAIFLGPTLYLENLHTIYGKECVRIHRISQLEEAVSDLLEMTLRGVENVY